MVEKEIRHEIHDMSSKIYELQAKQNTLSNGQRYAAINEIEKCISPLRSDLHHLERKLYSQESDDKILQDQIDNILQQINDLEDIKSDLTARINTETEHTRQELNDKIINFMSTELNPIKESIENNKQEIASVKDDISDLKESIIQNEHEREKKEIARFDNFKVIITAVVAVITALSTISLLLEPSIRTLIHIFF